MWIFRPRGNHVGVFRVTALGGISGPHYKQVANYWCDRSSPLLGDDCSSLAKMACFVPL